MRAFLISLFVAEVVLSAYLPQAFNNSIFKSPEYTTSQGGAASCISGRVDLSVSFESQQWTFDIPENQLQLTDWVFTYTTLGTAAFSSNGTRRINKSYEIWVQYCIPKPAGLAIFNASSLQILTHGGSLDHSYWDFAQGYSYVDAAAAQGMATLNYDRLGIGHSEHPDPLFEVQGDAATSVLHSLITLARNGAFGHTFAKVIGVGHSYGSKITESIVSNYPKDFDAVLLTGYAYRNAVGAGNPIASGYEVAQSDRRFTHLPHGYVATRYPEGIHLLFFKYPNFDQAIFTASLASLQTTTLGEMLIPNEEALVGNITSLQAYSGSVMILVGNKDYSVCGFSCDGDDNPAASTLRDIFPSVNPSHSKIWIVPDIGHNTSLHSNAAEVFGGMLSWVRKLN
ncbi:uncharacterized protein CTRU02_203212 [Colletotrichum truncatum]|uniref:Uncharacterized protein n=1 Tax=Colletotrichum truncatum TaxID=5467 RepID=A0ACC3Z8M7_COLTU|nr:uncharacterized protein CTRU02_09051 [Colletotrichum truncatum]KAF6789259.1 hypothetical protein CTRU02_09051 [Colletotrichum truncatum]